MSLESDLEVLGIEQEAVERFYGGYPDAQIRATRYEKYHKYYSPIDGDQWPEDRALRPDQLHITANIVRRFVDTEARLLSIRPRIFIPTSFMNKDDENRSEATEKLFQQYLDRSGFDEWSFVFNQTKSLYGIGVMKPFWNQNTNMPDVSIVEQPQNLVFGWGDSEFHTIDWTIYHYAMSRAQAKRKYPQLTDEQMDYGARFLPENIKAGDHADPINTLDMTITQRLGRQKTKYELSHVAVWDYWYIGDDGTVYNAILVAGKLVEGPIAHPEMPVIPYIVAESDHEPGSPDGHSTAELLIDVQMGLNRAITHYAQHVWDTTDPAFQLIGENAPVQGTTLPIPRPGEAVSWGPGVQVDEIRSGVNNFPFDALLGRYMETAYRITGLSEILFGAPPAAQTSGRALQAQLESSINALDPKRQRYYEALRGLLAFWHFMASKKNPTVDSLKVADVIKSMNRWRIEAPEISPRDTAEHIQNVANKLNAKMISLQTAMDEVGIDNPIEEMNRVMAERSNAHLFPGDAQAIAAVVATLQSISQNNQAQAQAAQGQQDQNAAQQDAQQAAPGYFNDQNQPPTGAGGPPPQGAPAPGGGIGQGAMLQPLVRQTPTGNSQALSQIVLPRRRV